MRYILSVAAAGILSSIASANLVTNGGFEDTQVPAGSHNVTSSISGWTVVSSPVALIGMGYLGAPSQEVDLSGIADDSSGVGLSQVINTVAGQKYLLTADVYTGQSSGYSGGVNVFVDASLIGSNIQGAAGRTPYGVLFTATGATTTLKFLSDHGNVSHLDNVTVNAVPEPASMAALGLGALGLIRRRRANKA